MGRDDGAESQLSRGSVDTATSSRAHKPTPYKPPRATPSRQGSGRPSAVTPAPSGTPRSAAPATRSRTQSRVDAGSRGSRLGRGGGGGREGGSEPSSPRCMSSRGGAASSFTSESVSGDFEELLNMEDTARSADNVKVIVRVRPLNEREQREAGSKQCVTSIGAHTVMLTDPNRPEPFTGTYDYVLGSSTSQEDVYKVAGEAVVDNCMAGFNSSIFAYGQTGAGKTYTMQGTAARDDDGQLSKQCGLILRVFEQLFQRISDEEHEKGLDRLRYSVKCSFLEIYNEVITDLLRPTSSGLNVRDGDIKRGVYVEDLSETYVVNADDVIALMAKGSANRHMAETKMNHESSRSHSVFTCTIEAHERAESGLTNVKYSKLNLIDLAGSERVGKSGATGERLTEAQSINKSLTTLGRVISALVERQKRPSTHVPYRDSRLTFLLQESLGGNSKTCIIANVSPSAESAQETHSTLLFAAGAKKIKNKAVVNEDTQGDMRALQLENVRLSRLLEEARAQLAAGAEALHTAEQAALREQLRQTEDTVAELRERNARLETVFDQSNAAISQLQGEHAAAKKDLAEARSTVARLTDESVGLRTDNQGLANELAQLRETYEQERHMREEEGAQLRQEMESLTAQLLEAEQTAHLLQRQGQEAASDLARERHDSGQLRKELEEERAGRQEALLARDASSAELRRAQRSAEDERRRHKAAERRLQAENEELYQAAKGLRGEFEGLKMQLSEEVVRVAKYRRMADEVSKLINAVQNSPKAGAGGRAGALPSPLGSLGNRRRSVGPSPRLPIAVTEAAAAAAADLGSPNNPLFSPLAELPNNRRSSFSRSASIGSAVPLLSPKPGAAGCGAAAPSPASSTSSKPAPKLLLVGSPAGKSPLASPAPLR
ncbi:hypothetical protein N2152v2_007337 [Parachlorella kessleri]